MTPDVLSQEFASFNERELRNTLGRFATGITVVTAHQGFKPHGMTANAFVPISLNPPLVLVSLNSRCKMRRILVPTARFGVSVLAEHQRSLSEHFGGTGSALKVEFITRAGAALIEGSIAHIAGNVVKTYQAGDHTLVIGEVEYCEQREDSPLLFYAGHYRRLDSQSL
jgi:flavin reductase (DIM6/NTAB) family NADH-FMN oxidoreductase RutF